MSFSARKESFAAPKTYYKTTFISDAPKITTKSSTPKKSEENKNNTNEEWKKLEEIIAAI